jgi:hypothetical protein
MKPEQMTEALEQVATQVGVRVRYETMTGDTAGAGGLCKLRGEWTVIIDRRTPPADRAAMLIEALAGFDTDQVFLPPKVREALNARRASARGESAGSDADNAGGDPAEAPASA